MIVDICFPLVSQVVVLGLEDQPSLQVLALGLKSQFLSNITAEMHYRPCPSTVMYFCV